MKKIILIVMVSFTCVAFVPQILFAGDGTWDYGRGGVDRDMDNDGVWIRIKVALIETLTGVSNGSLNELSANLSVQRTARASTALIK